MRLWPASLAAWSKPVNVRVIGLPPASVKNAEVELFRLMSGYQPTPDGAPYYAFLQRVAGDNKLSAEDVLDWVACECRALTPPTKSDLARETFARKLPSALSSHGE